MFVYRKKSLYLPDCDLWIDPPKPRQRAFVSHGHGDHIGRHEHIITTRETARIIEHRLGPREFTVLDWGEPLTLGKTTLRLHPAGHILGAAQLEVQYRGETMVYSGDFRLKKSETAEQCRVVPCDMLVMECTYGRPHYRFPPRDEVIPALVADLKALLEEQRTPVVLAYSLGRGQELLKLLEPYQLDIHLAPPIYQMARVYEELGVRFGPYQMARPGRTDGVIVFVPPHAQTSRIVRRAKNPVTIAATGWALDGKPPYPADRCFPLSDHADFDELKQYVREAKPREVYTMHGFDEFQQHLRDEGTSAFPVETRVPLS